MSIKIFGKRIFKSPIEKERERLKDVYSKIAEAFDEYCIEHQEDAYTESLQDRKTKIAERLDEIGWSHKQH